MTAAALLAVATAMVLVRVGWQGPRGVAALGWALGATALIALLVQDGAWGLSVGMVVGMAVALAFVLYAGWTSPMRNVRAPREKPAISIPHHRRDLARRLAVFALAVPVAFAAAQWLAFGIQAAFRGGAALDHDREFGDARIVGRHRDRGAIGAVVARDSPGAEAARVGRAGACLRIDRGFGGSFRPRPARDRARFGARGGFERDGGVVGRAGVAAGAAGRRCEQ